MFRLMNENQMLKNTNYYLLCTIHKLENQQLSKYKEDIQEISNFISLDEKEYNTIHDTICHISSENVSNTTEKMKTELEEKLKEILVLRTELEDSKTEIESLKQTLENKIIDLEREKDNLQIE